MASHPTTTLFKRSRRLLNPTLSPIPPIPRRWSPSTSSRSVTILAPGPGPSNGNSHGSNNSTAILEPDDRYRDGGSGSESGGNSKPPRDATPSEGDADKMTISMAGPNAGRGDTPLDRIINAMPGPSSPPFNAAPETQYQGSSSHPFASIPIPPPTSTSNLPSIPSSSSSSSNPNPKPTARPPPLHPFDTHAFVRHMESSSFSPGASRSIMRATERMVVQRSKKAVDDVLHKEDIENAAYLFAAALSELRTELSVRARNDGLALRSTSSLIRREVDALGQRMKEDIGGVKHDIEMDMNNRKAETRTEQKGYDIAIEEINNKFTISIGDLKTEIEQAKWDATRRAITIIAGIVFACISIITLSGEKPAPPATKPIPMTTSSTATQARMRDIGVGDEDDAALLERLEGLAALGRERAVAAAVQGGRVGPGTGTGVGAGEMQSTGFAAGDERFGRDGEGERAV